jgi:aspartate-semialdehyde dehydrogenase
MQRVIVSTYQAASGAGEKGMRTLIQDSHEALAQQGICERGLLDFNEGLEASAAVFGHPLAFNLVPQIDVFVEEGRTREELKMVQETRKIFGIPDLPIEATCVRVPLLRSHAESVAVETRDPVDLDEVRGLIREAAGLELVDDPANRSYPMPSLSSGRDPVLVGRLRPSGVFTHGLSFFLSGDQLMKGAALNGLQIVQALADPS